MSFLRFHSLRTQPVWALAIAAALLAWIGDARSEQASPVGLLQSISQQSDGLTDLDKLVQKTLLQRQTNREDSKDYLVDELERVELLGPGRIPVFWGKREYSWFLRDGVHVRSPIRVDDVAVDPEERRKQEDAWIAEEKEALALFERRRATCVRFSLARGSCDQFYGTGGLENFKTGGMPSLELLTKALEAAGLRLSALEESVDNFRFNDEPRFVADAHFVDLSFSPGQYYLVGREKVAGRETLKIEFYPVPLDIEDPDPISFTPALPGPPSQKKPKAKDKVKVETYYDLDDMFDKTSVVTLWIDPADSQLIQFTLENRSMNFLRGYRMTRAKSMKATTVFEQPFKGVWLPHSVNAEAILTVASGPLEIHYSREFTGYKRAEVSTRIQPVPTEKQ